MRLLLPVYICACLLTQTPFCVLVQEECAIQRNFHPGRNKGILWYFKIKKYFKYQRQLFRNAIRFSVLPHFHQHNKDLVHFSPSQCPITVSVHIFCLPPSLQKQHLSFWQCFCLKEMIYLPFLPAKLQTTSESKQGDDETRKLVWFQI